ncbi:MAG: methyltransferase type 11, partial [Candidatus Omnitrophota bacterium]
MCDKYCIDFGKKYLGQGEVAGKDLIEVGSLNVNCTLRPDIERYLPSSYIGVDIQPGPGVDRICRVEDLIAQFGK